jgi:hypothetical protein
MTPRSLALTWHGNGPYGDVAFDSVVHYLDALPAPPFETFEITGTEVGVDRVGEAVTRIIAKWPQLKTALIFGIRAS